MSVTTEYRDLLVEFTPQPIHSRQAYRRAIAQVEQLMVPKPGVARSRLIEMLSTLVEDYESREHPTPQVPCSQMLAHLLKTRGQMG
jgi:antitoxin component HigA of HigAB toxin-antitoxin module